MWFICFDMLVSCHYGQLYNNKYSLQVVTFLWAFFLHLLSKKKMSFRVMRYLITVTNMLSNVSYVRDVQRHI